MKKVYDKSKIIYDSLLTKNKESILFKYKREKYSGESKVLKKREKFFL